MCEYCFQTPHLHGCPNEPEPVSVFVCSGCGESIYEGEDYWDLMGEQWCEECIDDARRWAIYDPY